MRHELFLFLKPILLNGLLNSIRQFFRVLTEFIQVQKNNPWSFRIREEIYPLRLESYLIKVELQCPDISHQFLDGILIRLSQKPQRQVKLLRLLPFNIIIPQLRFQVVLHFGNFLPDCLVFDIERKEVSDFSVLELTKLSKIPYKFHATIFVSFVYDSVPFSV